MRVRHPPGAVARALEVTVLLILWCRSSNARAREQANLALNEAGQAARALAQGKSALAANPRQDREAKMALSQACAPGADPGITAEACFRLGVLDEDEVEFLLALTDYARSATEAPNSVWARNSRRRIAWLKGHAEGDFVPLERFERARRDGTTEGGRPEIEALARDADGFPDGRTRSEARMLVAQVWLRMPERSRDAAEELRKILEDPSAEPKTKLFAERDLVGFWLARGAVDQAAEVLRIYPLDPQQVTKVRDLLRTRKLRRSVVVISGLLGLAVVGLAARRRRRAVRRL